MEILEGREEDASHSLDAGTAGPGFVGDDNPDTVETIGPSLASRFPRGIVSLPLLTLIWMGCAFTLS